MGSTQVSSFVPNFKLARFREKHEIGKMKMATSDEKLLAKCPPQMLIITEHLRTLDYYKRPDYQLIFDVSAFSSLILTYHFLGSVSNA
jgi:hypothetical protein